MSLAAKENKRVPDVPPESEDHDSTPQEMTKQPVDEKDHNDKSPNIPLEDSQLQPTTSRMPRPQSLPSEILFLTIICCSQLLTQAGLATSIIPQHIIARSFDLENQPGTLSWFSAAYSLTVGTFILIAGRLGDVFGYKRLFVGGWIWYGVWSALAGVAVYSGPIFFAFCRAMQGIGPAFLIPNAIAMLANTYEPGMRLNIIFSLFGATAPGGFLLGAVFSSLLAERAWWPWAFWTLAVVCVGIAGLAVFVIPAFSPPKDPEHDESNIWQRVDVFGSVIGVSALVLFNFAWNQAPVVGWSEPYTYVLLVVGILLFGVFVLVERRVRHPLIPFGVLKIDSGFTLACISAAWSSFGIFLYYALDFLEVLRKHSPLTTSAQFAPIAISGLCAAISTGLCLSYFRASTVMLLSMTAFCTGGIIFATMPVQQTYWAQTFVGVIILPWGMDMSFPAATIILSRAMPRKHQGLAASLVNTFVNYSISIGLGVAGTVNSQVLQGGRSLLASYRASFYLGIGLCGLGIVVALAFCFLERRRSSVGKEESGEADQA